MHQRPPHRTASRGTTTRLRGEARGAEEEGAGGAGELAEPRRGIGRDGATRNKHEGAGRWRRGVPPRATITAVVATLLLPHPLVAAAVAVVAGGAGRTAGGGLLAGDLLAAAPPVLEVRRVSPLLPSCGTFCNLVSDGGSEDLQA